MIRQIRFFSSPFAWLTTLILMIGVAGCNFPGVSEPSATPLAPAAGIGAPTATPAAVALSDLPEVEIRSPAEGSEAVVNTSVQVFVSAADRQGVTRIELRADSLLVDSAGSPQPQGSPSLNVLLAWTPTVPGPHVLQVVAYRGATKGNPKTINIVIRENAALVTRPAASRTPTALPAVGGAGGAGITATPSDVFCRAQVRIDGLNFREGPGTNYVSLSTLKAGDIYQVTGRNEDVTWYQIVVGTQFGWVSASFITLTGVCSTIFEVPIPPSPIPPVGATAVAVLPTFTPIPAFSVPPTATIRVVVLPTLTFTPLPGPNPVDLTVTAVSATQTQIARMPTLPPSTVIPPTLTPVPSLPNIKILGAGTTDNTVILQLGAGGTQSPFFVNMVNQGTGVAPIFRVSATLPDGRVFFTNTAAPINPGQQTSVNLSIPFTTVGVQRVIVQADADNAVTEADKSDNTFAVAITAVQATPQANQPTITPTLTYTPPPPTVPPTLTPVLPTLTLVPPSAIPPTLTVPPVVTVPVILTLPPTLTPLPPPSLTPIPAVNTDIPVQLPTLTPIPPPPTLTPVPVSVITATPFVPPTLTPLPPSATPVQPTKRPEATLPPPPTLTAPPPPPSLTPIPPVPVTATPLPPIPTFTPIPPTKRPEATLPPPPTLTPVPPPPTLTPVPPTPIPPPPTAIPPTLVPPTPIPPPPTAIPPTPVPPTPIPPPPTLTPIPPTKVPPTPIPPTPIPPTPIPPTKVPPTLTPLPPPPTDVPAPTMPPPPPQVTSIAVAGNANLANYPVVANLNSNPNILNRVRTLARQGRGARLQPNKVVFIGDSGLNNIRSLNLGSVALDGGSPMGNATAFFAPNFQSGLESSTVWPAPGAFPAFSLIDAGKLSGNCGGRSAIQCAVDANPSVIFIAVGRDDIQANTPVPEFSRLLNEAINVAEARNIIVVLMTIPDTLNPADFPKLDSYNTAIFAVATQRNLPIVNLFGLRSTPNLFAGGNPTVRGDVNNLTQEGRKIGANAVNYAILEMMEQLRSEALARE